MVSISSKFNIDFCYHLQHLKPSETISAVYNKDYATQIASNVLQSLIKIENMQLTPNVTQAFLFVLTQASEDTNNTKKMLLRLLPLLVYRLSPFFYEPLFVTQNQSNCVIPLKMQNDVLYPFLLNEPLIEKNNVFLVKNEPYDNPIVNYLSLKTYMATQPSAPFLYVYVLQVALACQVLQWSKVKHNQLNCASVDLIELQNPYSQQVTCGSHTVLFNHDENLKYSVILSRFDTAELVEPSVKNGTEETDSKSVESLDTFLSTDFISFFKDFCVNLNSLYNLSYEQNTKLLSIVADNPVEVLRQWGLSISGPSIESSLLNINPIITPPLQIDLETTANLITSYASDELLAALATGTDASTDTEGISTAPVIIRPDSPFFVNFVGHEISSVFPLDNSNLIPVLAKLKKKSADQVKDVSTFYNMNLIIKNVKNLVSQSRVLSRNILIDNPQPNSLNYVARKSFFHKSGDVNVGNIFMKK